MENTESPQVRSLLNGVRLVVQRGASRRTSMELFPAEPLTRIVIGSSSQCDWRIFARGVRARHLRLIWSHGRLRIDDVCEPGAVKLDGRPVCHRIELCAAATVSFGEAILAVEPASGAGPASENLLAEAATVQNGLLGQVEGSSAGAVIDAPTPEQAPRERQVRGHRRRPLWRSVAVFSLAMVALLASAAARAAFRAPQGRSAQGSAAATLHSPSPRKMRPSVAPAHATPASASTESFAGTVSPNEAVARLVAGRRSEALEAYRALASKQPANRAYATVVQVLDRRSASRCPNGESACAP